MTRNDDGPNARLESPGDSRPDENELPETDDRDFAGSDEEEDKAVEADETEDEEEDLDDEDDDADDDDDEDDKDDDEA